MLRRFSGAQVRRVIDRSRAHVPEHAHDWPVLSIFVMGGYLNRTELDATFIAGPSVILYRAGTAHQNAISSAGFEQIEIEFDPAWLGHMALPDAPVSRWLGGQLGAESRTLAQVSSHETVEGRLRAHVQRFIERAYRESQSTMPNWLAAITQRLRENTALNVSDLAREVGRHPSWLGTAYRRAVGEGLLDTAARYRVERAACLLRETDLPSARVAAEAGFCDQSHMSRTFRRILGRLPSGVREDRHGFRQATGVSGGRHRRGPRQCP